MLRWLFRRPAPPPATAATMWELLALARHEAAVRRQEFVGTQHLLLALADLTDRAVGRALAGVAPALGDALAEHLTPGSGTEPPEHESPAVKRALDRAEAFAEHYGHAVATPEHVLLALLADHETIAFAVLTGLGVRPHELGVAVVREAF